MLRNPKAPIINTHTVTRVHFMFGAPFVCFNEFRNQTLRLSLLIHAQCMDHTNKSFNFQISMGLQSTKFVRRKIAELAN